MQQAVEPDRSVVQLFSQLTVDSMAPAARSELSGRIGDIREFLRNSGPLASPFYLPDQISSLGAPLVPVLVDWLTAHGTKGDSLGFDNAAKLLTKIAAKEPEAVRAHAASLKQVLDGIVSQNYMQIYRWDGRPGAVTLGKLAGSIIEDPVEFVAARKNLLLNGNSHSSPGNPHPGQVTQAAALMAVIDGNRSAEAAALLRGIITEGSYCSPLIPFAYQQYVLHGNDWAARSPEVAAKNFHDAILTGFEIAHRHSDGSRFAALDEASRKIAAQTLTDIALYEPHGDVRRIRALELLREVDRSASDSARLQILAQKSKDNPAHVEYVFMTYREVQPYCLYTLLRDAEPAKVPELLKFALGGPGTNAGLAEHVFNIISDRAPLKTPIALWDGKSDWKPMMIEAPLLDLESGNRTADGRLVAAAVSSLVANYLAADGTRKRHARFDQVSAQAIGIIVNLKGFDDLRALASGRNENLAVQTLECSGMHFTELVKSYEAGLRSESPEVRKAAVRGLCKSDNPAARELLRVFGAKAMFETFSTNTHDRANPIATLAERDQAGASELLNVAIDRGGRTAGHEEYHALRGLAALLARLTSGSAAPA